VDKNCPGKLKDYRLLTNNENLRFVQVNSLKAVNYLDSENLEMSTVIDTQVPGKQTKPETMQARLAKKAKEI
jgi:hypothetical protein